MNPGPLPPLKRGKDILSGSKPFRREVLKPGKDIFFGFRPCRRGNPKERGPARPACPGPHPRLPPRTERSADPGSRGDRQRLSGRPFGFAQGRLPTHPSLPPRTERSGDPGTRGHGLRPFGSLLGPGSRPGRQKCWGFGRLTGAAIALEFRGIGSRRRPGFPRDTPPPRDMLGKAAPVHAAIPPPL